MSIDTAGEIVFWGPGTIERPLHFPLLFTIRIDLCNFDIDVSEPKAEHKRFLAEKIVPMLKKTPGSAVALLGSASRSGESRYNYGLSTDRAEAVKKLLLPIDANHPVNKPVGLGSPVLPGPKEDKHDRAVQIYLVFKIKIDDLSFYTDDWSRKLCNTDVIGVDADDARKISKINMELTLSGAPRSLTDGGIGASSVMPFNFPFEAVSTRNGLQSSSNEFPLTMAEDKFQTKGDFATVYHSDWYGCKITFPDEVIGTVAAVVNEGTSDLRKGNFLSSRGRAPQAWTGTPDNSTFPLPPALSLLKSGGIEVISIRAKDIMFPLVSFIFRRSFATVFYYAGDGNRMGSLTLRSKYWANPEDLLRYWQRADGMEALILAAPDVLLMSVSNGVTTAALPGSRWTRLLRRNGGPFAAILGYWALAPDLKSVAEEIATKMGRKIAKGLGEDDWVKAWLEVNGENPGDNTLNAVGMDRKGYWWIEAVDKVDATFRQLKPKSDWVTPNPGHMVNVVPGPVKKAWNVATGPSLYAIRHSLMP